MILFTETFIFEKLAKKNAFLNKPLNKTSGRQRLPVKHFHSFYPLFTASLLLLQAVLRFIGLSKSSDTGPSGHPSPP